MQTFVFKARDRSTGQEVNSEVQADSEQQAAKMLIERNLFPVLVEPKDKPKAGIKLPFSKRVSSKEKVLFTRQLSTLISAGLPILQALRSVQDQIDSETMRAVVDQVVVEVEGGAALSVSLAKHPKIFNQTYISVVEAGETSGSLDKTLARLAHQLEKDGQIASKVRGALVYPVIVLTVVVLVVVFMLLVVMPQVGGMYKDFNKELPIMTKFLLNSSTVISRFWWLFLIATAGSIYGLKSYIKTSQGRRQFDGFKMRIPLFGALLKKVYMARFARSMATLLSSGVPILNALATTRGAVNNEMVAEDIDATATDVRGGKALSACLKEKPNFLKLVPQMIKIGEDSGAIDATLDKLAVYYEDEIDETVKNLSTAIEPVLMVVLAVVVGFILMSVLLPIYGLVGQGLTQ